MRKLVVQGYASAPFWPLICPDVCHLASYVQYWCSIACYDILFLPGHSGYNIDIVLQHYLFIYLMPSY